MAIHVSTGNELPVQQRSSSACGRRQRDQDRCDRRAVARRFTGNVCQRRGQEAEHKRPPAKGDGEMRWRWVCVALLLAGCVKGPQPPVVPTSGVDSEIALLLAERREHVLKNSDDAEAWGRLGQAFHAAELYGQAEKCYGRAIMLSPEAPRWRHLAG